MTRRYQTGLHAVVSISIVLLMIWGIDLSRSVAYDDSASPYRADVNIWADGPFFDMLQNMAANQPGETDFVVILRSDRGLLIWKHNTHADSENDAPIHLSRQARECFEERVILIAFTAPNGMDQGPGRAVVLIHEVLTGESTLYQTPRTRIDLPITYPFGG